MEHYMAIIEKEIDEEIRKMAEVVSEQGEDQTEVLSEKNEDREDINTTMLD